MLEHISYIYKYCQYLKNQNSNSKEYEKNCEYKIYVLNEKAKVLGIEYREEEWKNDKKTEIEKGFHKSNFRSIENNIGSINFEIFNEIKDKLPERKYISGEILEKLKVENESFKLDFEKLKDIISQYEQCKLYEDKDYVGAGRERNWMAFKIFCVEFLPFVRINIFQNCGTEYNVEEEIKLKLPSSHLDYDLKIEDFKKKILEIKRKSIEKIKEKLPGGKYINVDNLMKIKVLNP
uniref:Uncharacterized protein n=1 Tax=Meloidogyne incognita TaxID=6306 RepID=A0A914LUV5_MELIC